MSGALTSHWASLLAAVFDVFFFLLSFLFPHNTNENERGQKLAAPACCTLRAPRFPIVHYSGTFLIYLAVDLFTSVSHAALAPLPLGRVI